MTGLKRAFYAAAAAYAARRARRGAAVNKRWLDRAERWAKRAGTAPTSNIGEKL